MPTRDDLKRRLLGVLSVSGGITVGQLAKELGTKPHVVRYQMQQLIDSNTIRRTVLVNPWALGLQAFNIFFDLPPRNAKAAIEFLKGRPEVLWLARNGGPRRYEVTLIAEDFRGIREILEALGEDVGVHVERPVFSVEGEMCHWGLRFLLEATNTPPLVRFAIPKEPVKLDELDRQLVWYFNQVSEATVNNATRVVHAAQSTIQYRLKRLKDEQVISDDVFFPTLQQGFVQAQLVLNMLSRSKENQARIFRFCQDEKNVQSLICGVGSWDFKLIVDGDSIGDILTVQDRLNFEFSKIIAGSSLYIRDEILLSTPGFAKPHNVHRRSI